MTTRSAESSCITRNGTIENNQFIRNYEPGLFLVCLATKYSEGCNPSNVVIRNNLFDGNDIKRKDFAEHAQQRGHRRGNHALRNRELSGLHAISFSKTTS